MYRHSDPEQLLELLTEMSSKLGTEFIPLNNDRGNPHD